MSTTGAGERPILKWRLVVVWAGLPLLLAALNEFALNVALPSIRDEFGLDLSSVRWTLLAFLIADALVLILAGRYGDRVGRRRTSAIGLAVIVLGSLVCAFAPTFTVLIVGRVIEGIGMGILFSGLLALIADAVPRELIGRAFGLWAFIGALSVLLSPVIGGALAEVASWRWIFGVNALIAIAALVAARRVILPVTAPSPSRSLQHAALLRIRSYVAGTVVVSLIYFTAALTWLALVFYVGAVHNLGPTMTGLAFVLYGVWWLVLPPFTGRLADRIGVRLPMLWGATVGAIGFIVLAFASPAENLVLLGLGLCLIGIGVAFVIPAANAAAMGSVPAEDRGDASGINMTMRLVGSILGLVVGSTLLASAGRDEVIVGAQWSWILAAALMILAAIVSMTAIRPSTR